MIEKFLGITTGFSIVDIGILAALVTIIVEVLKQVFPKELPTQILATCVSLFASLMACFSFHGVTTESIFLGIILGFIVAFVSMKGFDSLKEIIMRFTLYHYDQIDEEDKKEVKQKQLLRGKNGKR